MASAHRNRHDLLQPRVKLATGKTQSDGESGLIGPRQDEHIRTCQTRSVRSLEADTNICVGRFLRFDSLPLLLLDFFASSSSSSIAEDAVEADMNRTALTALVWPPQTASGVLW